MRLLALDQGTSATKALVVEDDGSVLAEAEVAVEVSTGAGGSVEVDPEDLWSSVVEAGRQAVAMAGVDVDGVGLANQGETVLAWEPATGRPCSAGIVWQDRRSAPICERIAAAGGAERLTAITGLELDPYFVAPKMVWLQEQLEAAELAHMGAGRVVVVERDQEPGGIPRHTNHTGFGLRDLRRLLSGPAYASRLVDRAVAEGADVRCGTSALGWEAVRTTLSVLEPGSPASPWPARAVILATGTRERPRSARLVPGDHPAGVLTTGALQQQVRAGIPVGRRAVIVGAEHVSFSAVLTLAHGGCRTVALLTELPRHRRQPAPWRRDRRRLRARRPPRRPLRGEMAGAGQLAEPAVPLQAEPPVHWAHPSVVRAGERPARGRYLVRVAEFLPGRRLSVVQGERLLCSTLTAAALAPNRSISLRSGCEDRVDPSGPPVIVMAGDLR